jgi:tRNA(His) guanylyltransferase
MTAMSENTPLDIRMKDYEHTFRRRVPRRAYTLMRLDGRAFHTYLRNAQRPFDRDFINDMDLLAVKLCEEIQGARFAYVQSDEISLLLTDFDTPQSELWFGGNVAKLVSVSSGVASAYFMYLRYFHGGMPHFDSRVWSMSDPVEVANYFVWRQRDAVRNSIQMVGQFHFTQEELHGRSCDQIQEMLWSQKGVNWDAFPPECKRGRLVAPVDGEGLLVMGAPQFKAEPDRVLARLIPELPSLRRE